MRVCLFLRLGGGKVFRVKNEVNNYLKDLNNMNIVKNEIKTRDKIIAKEREAHQETRTIMGNTIAQQNKIIAEYERKFGALK